MRDWRQAQRDYDALRMLVGAARETWEDLGRPGPTPDMDPYDDTPPPVGFFLGWHFSDDVSPRDDPDDALERLRHAGRPPRWRTWKLTRRLVSKLYVLGISSGSGSALRDGHPMYVDHLSWAWSKKWNGTRELPPYILGWSKDKWRCLLRYRHWPYWPDGRPVAFGHCGKCCPWPCCGSIETEHAEACMEALA